MRFFKADCIFPVSSPPVANGILVTKNDGTILSIHDHEEDVFKTYPGLKKRDYRPDIFKGILCPGFVNVHCHLELSYLKKQIRKGGGMVSFIKQLLKKRNVFSEKEISDAIKSADEEMYNEGIVAVGDISNSDHTFKQKAKSKIYYHTFIETLDLKPGNASHVFFLAEGLKAKLHKAAPRNSASSIVPHAPYTVTTGLFELIRNYPHNKVITIHNQESKAENDFFKSKKGTLHDFFVSIGNDPRHVNKTGKNSVYYSLPYIKHSDKVILVHNTFTSKQDVEYILDQKPSASFCLCPNANLFIENALPAINNFIKSGANICFGTDSYASNDRLSVLSEMKTISARFKKLSAEEIIYWATRGGAVALGIENRYGSFEAGKKPGIVHISMVKEGKLTAGSKSRRVL